MIFNFLDQLIATIIKAAHFFFFLFISRILKKNEPKRHEKKKILLVFSGKPHKFPQDKASDNNFKKCWDKYIALTYLHSDSFDRSYILAFGEKNECYRLASNIVFVVLKKTSIDKFKRVGSTIDFIRELYLSYTLNKKIDFTIIENYVPGDAILLSVFIKKLIKKPLFAAVAGDADLSSFDEDPNKETLKTFIRRQINKLITSIGFRHADIVLAFSPHVSAFAICNGASPHKVRKLRVHSYNENYEAYNIAPKNQLKGYPQENQVVFYGGRLSPEKKHFYAFEAIKQVFDERPNTKLVIAGDGPLKELVQKQLKNYIDNVIFFDYVEPLTLKGYMYYSDVCLVPLGGYALVEAALCKKPVVAFNWEWHEDLITNHESGYLIDYPNIEDFKEAVLELLDNPKKGKAMGEILYKNTKKLIDNPHEKLREKKIWEDFFRERNM